MTSRGNNMDQNQSRRAFLGQCAKIGGFCSMLCFLNKDILAQDSTGVKEKKADKKLDLKKYSYCGTQCDNQCELFKATKENNNELKKKVYENWNWKQKFGFEFDPEKVFCYGCKPGKLALKPGIKECLVRICAIENKLESCIECKQLASCKKDFWQKYPDFYKHVIELQKQIV
jgi:hypothetical protein